MEPLATAHDTAGRVRRREISAREAAQDALKRIEAANPALNAFIHVDPETALRQADAVDAAIARGIDPGPLAGVPVGVKDMEPVAGMPLTFGSRAFAHNVADHDSVQVARLKNAGAVVMGKTNTPEFAYKGFTANRLFGATRNPWNPERTPGGSSGGSTAAVAAGMVALCTAGDGGGSIRVPAAFSGCYGIKPSAGRIPRAGANAPTWSTHGTLGPVSRTVRDAARYLDICAGPHPNDLDALDAPPGAYEAATLAPAPRLKRIAWSADLGFAPVDPEVRRIAGEAGRALAEAVGAELVEANPGFADPIDTWFTIAAPGDARAVAAMTEEQRALLERGFLAWADQATRITAVMLAEALEARHQLNRAMTAFFQTYDLLLTPTVPCTAFLAGGPPPTEIDGQAVTPAGFVAFTSPFNTTGHPAASLPAGLASDGLPVGLQVVAPRHADALVLAASAAYEAARPWRWPGDGS